MSAAARLDAVIHGERRAVTFRGAASLLGVPTREAQRALRAYDGGDGVVLCWVVTVADGAAGARAVRLVEGARPVVGEGGVCAVEVWGVAPAAVAGGAGDVWVRADVHREVEMVRGAGGNELRDGRWNPIRSASAGWDAGGGAERKREEVERGEVERKKELAKRNGEGILAQAKAKAKAREAQRKKKAVKKAVHGKMTQFATADAGGMSTFRPLSARGAAKENGAGKGKNSKPARPSSVPIPKKTRRIVEEDDDDDDEDEENGSGGLSNDEDEEERDDETATMEREAEALEEEEEEREDVDNSNPDATVGSDGHVDAAVEKPNDDVVQARSASASPARSNGSIESAVMSPLAPSGEGNPVLRTPAGGGDKRKATDAGLGNSGRPASGRSVRRQVDETVEENGYLVTRRVWKKFDDEGNEVPEGGAADPESESTAENGAAASAEEGPRKSSTAPAATASAKAKKKTGGAAEEKTSPTAPASKAATKKLKGTAKTGSVAKKTSKRVKKLKGNIMSYFGKKS